MTRKRYGVMMGSPYEIIGADLDDLLLGGDDDYDDYESGYDYLEGDDDDLDDLDMSGDIYDTLSGYDEIVGAKAKKKLSKAAKQIKALKKKLALVAKAKTQSGRALVRRGYTRDRALFLSFGSVELDPSATPPTDRASILANPQVPFRPRRLIISASSEVIVDPINQLVVNDIKVGKDSQLIASGGFPASGFSGPSNEMLFKADTASPGIDITIDLENTNDSYPMTVTVGMVGYAAE